MFHKNYYIPYFFFRTMSSLERKLNPFSCLRVDDLDEISQVANTSNNVREVLNFAAAVASSIQMDEVSEWKTVDSRVRDVYIQIEEPKKVEVVIEIPEETEATEAADEDDGETVSDEQIFEQLGETLNEYASYYTEEIEKSKVHSTPVAYLVVAMICDIIAKLAEIKEKNSVFSKIVVKGLFGIPVVHNGEKDEVNLIELLYSFLQICIKYDSFDFKDSTFGTSCGKSKSKKGFDINYHLTHAEVDMTVGDCKNRFGVLLKAMRTAVGHIIYRTTRSYNPTPEQFENARYRVGTSDKTHWNQDFASFMEELSLIYAELEKLPKNLACIGDIFGKAKKEVADIREKKQALREEREKQREMQQKIREMRNFAKKSQDRQTARSRRYKDRVADKASEPVKSLPVKPIERSPISAPIKWGGYNPVTQNSAPAFNPSALVFTPQSFPAPSTSPIVRAPRGPPVDTVANSGFTTVQRRRPKPSPPVEEPVKLTGKDRKRDRCKKWRDAQNAQQSQAPQ